MITPKEIQQQCLNWWKNVLISYIEGSNLFPKEISRIGKITTKNLIERLPEYRKSLEILRSNSKSNKKFGYSLLEIERQFDKIGKQSVPEKIVIETLNDYLKITGKEKDYQTFISNYNLLVAELPNLKDWAILHPQKLIDNDVWVDIIKVCNYFIETPKPNVYIRELPIAVHTKFIEDNTKIIKELLDILIADHINQNEKDFEKRFNLKYAEPIVRFRVLDKNICLTYFSGIDDMSIPISQFEKLTLPLRKVFVVENKMNVLTFPIITDSIVIFGSGYSIEILKNAKWLKNIELWYWGDLDIQGFEILSKFRSYFPHVKSFLMDKVTFDAFSQYKGEGKSSKVLEKLNLSEEEKQQYEYLKTNNWRLEQEKILLKNVKEKIDKNIREYIIDIPAK